MAQSSLVISNFKTGFETDREPFNLDNDAFPTMNNMFLWRGRAQKKRGTDLLGRLQRGVTTGSLGNTNGSGLLAVNVFTTLLVFGATGGTLASLSPNASIVPGSVTITIGAQVFIEPSPPNGTLSNGAGGTGTINYATGAVSVQTNPVLATTAATITMQYYPNLPVMGLEDEETNVVDDPTLVAFDTTWSYQFNQSNNTFYDVNFYAVTDAPFVWTGQDYQQFWSTNYQNAMWVTNGVPGFHFNPIVSVTKVDATHATLGITANGLAAGDWIFINEVQGADAATINLQSGQVTVATTNTVTVSFPNATLGTTFSAGTGIAQYMTRNISGTGDGIRWYNGDPSSASGLGWVNFAPPLSNAATPQYLVGANIITPFKNRLIFHGVYLQASADGSPTFYPNRIVYSQDGTVYYASPPPAPQVSVDAAAWFQNVSGRGGFLTAPIFQQIVNVSECGDVLITNFETKPMKLVFTGDDTLPFIYQLISSEIGSFATFSGIPLDVGVLTVGEYGFAMTTQESSQRIDLKIIDQVFDISSANHGYNRVTSIRDFRNEFIYFTYSPNNKSWVYPSRTLLYNYREDNWAQLEENFTHYGNFRRLSGYTWATIPFKTWSAWTNPWNFGGIAPRFPDIIGGTQQGFVMIKDNGTREDTSAYISNIVGTSTGATVTSPAHCLNDGDFVEINGAIGMSNTNGIVFQIQVDQGNANDFTLVMNPFLSPPQLPPTGSYMGGGTYRRLSNINMLSKQFPIFWQNGRKSRIGIQRYLLDTTDDGQISVDIYTSQNSNYASSFQDATTNTYLPFTNVVTTSQSDVLFNTLGGAQTWHRMSNGFLGDTVQIGFSLNDQQMYSNDINSSEIAIHAIAFDLYPGPILV